MKRLIWLLLLLVSVAAYGQTNKIRLASDAWPPFTSSEKGSAFAMDLVNEALSRSMIKPSHTITNFKGVMEGIREGTFDGSAALWKNDEREEFLLFSVPYLQNQLMLVGRKGSDVGATSLGQLENKRVALVANYAYGPGVSESENVQLINSRSDQESLELLLKDRADYILVDALLVQLLLVHQGKEAAKYLEVAASPLFTKSLHFAVRKDHPEAEKIIQDFNREITKMMADGTYNEILNLNWIRADVDGDGNMELVMKGGMTGGPKAPSNSYGVWFKNTDSSQADEYYIGGKKYNNWAEVPSQYKQADPQMGDTGNFKILDFKF